MSILLDSLQHKAWRLKALESSSDRELKVRNVLRKRVVSTDAVDNSVEKTLALRVKPRRVGISLRLTKKRAYNKTTVKSSSYILFVNYKFSIRA